jgi:hypothetical protein
LFPVAGHVPVIVQQARGIYIIERALDQITRDVVAMLFRLLRESVGDLMEKAHWFWQPPTSSTI